MDTETKQGLDDGDDLRRIYASRGVLDLEERVGERKSHIFSKRRG
jgi:hypothetical protein